MATVPGSPRKGSKAGARKDRQSLGDSRHSPGQHELEALLHASMSTIKSSCRLCTPRGEAVAKISSFFLFQKILPKTWKCLRGGYRITLSQGHAGSLLCIYMYLAYCVCVCIGCLLCACVWPVVHVCVCCVCVLDLLCMYLACVCMCDWLVVHRKQSSCSNHNHSEKPRPASSLQRNFCAHWGVNNEGGRFHGWCFVESGG